MSFLSIALRAIFCLPLHTALGVQAASFFCFSRLAATTVLQCPDESIPRGSFVWSFGLCLQGRKACACYEDPDESFPNRAAL